MQKYPTKNAICYFDAKLSNFVAKNMIFDYTLAIQRRKNMDKLSKSKLVKTILNDVNEDMSNEEILDLIVEKNIAKNTDKKPLTFGQKASDAIARFAGSWGFILTFCAILVAWIVVNIILVSKAFDPYPFILLNLALSCVAALQAPIIMMSQNRQEQKDRQRAENDYQVNLKTEIIIKDLHEKIDKLIKNQEKILSKIDPTDNKTDKQK